MKTITRRLLMLLLAAVVAAGVTLRADDEAQKREFRAVWFTTMANIDWPSQTGTSAAIVARQKQTMLDYLDGFAATNINVVCFQVRPMADAFYRSSYEPWSRFLTGQRGKDPGWDPLAFCVEECHKRGMECHAWVNPYRFANGDLSNWNTPQDEAVKSANWLMSYNGTTIFNPGDPRSRERLVNVCREMLQNYDIDGIIFDDYFYVNGTPATSDQLDYPFYQNSGSSLSFADWRRAEVNKMVADVMRLVEEVKPQARFGIGPAGVAGTRATSAAKHGVDPCPTGSDWQYNGLYSDPLAWLEEGTIDYISPQLYWKTTHSTNPFEPLTKWWSYVAHHFGRHHFASHNIYFMANNGEGNNTTSWNEILAQLRFNRQYTENNAPGFNLYSSRYINGPTMTGLGDYMVQNVVPHKALPPAMTWRKGPSYDAPAGLAFDGGTLTWNKVEGTLVKYTVYAIPSTVPVDQIYSTRFDGIKSDYLLNITYEPQITIPEDKRTGHWFAVCVLDGYGNEYAPALYGTPQADADKVELLAPIADQVVDWQQTFSWQEAQDATFRLQVSDSEDFSTVLIDEQGLTSNETVVDLSSFKSATRYYWRVTVSQPERFNTESDVATFVTPQRPFAPVAQLLTPADGAQIDDNFLFLVAKDDAVTSYRMELSKTDDFATLISNNKMVDNGEAMQLDGIVAYLGLGTFHWRVVTSAEGCDDSVSPARSFTVTAIGTGATEPGYVVKRDIDNATYQPAASGLTLSNDWVRSIKSEYDNISYADAGTYNRSMTADKNHVYVTGRDKNAATAECYINVYSARSGEWLKRIDLDEEAQASYFPCNDIMLDDAGNLLVTNLVLNASTTPVQLSLVDTATGAVTTVATVTAGVKRIDHCRVTGDVTTGNFKLLAAVSRSNELVQWTFTGGDLTDTRVTTVTGEPADFGTAPRLLPLGGDKVLVNGTNAKVVRYDLASGANEGTVAASAALKPAGDNANGIAAFTWGGRNYLLYSYGDNISTNGYQFMLAAGDPDTALSGYEPLWVFPASGLGKVNSTTCSAPCVAVPGANENEMRLFVMACGNGLAAYTLRQPVALTGDVDGNGVINGSDVTALYTLLLNGTAPAGDPDVDGNGVVNGSDVTALYTILLTQ